MNHIEEKIIQTIDEHREERLSILSDHLDLAKSYLGMKK